MDLIKVADIIVEKIKKEYKDDIAIMCLYGSYIYGDIRENSDIDFYFIPKTPRGYKIMKAFIIGEIGFDFWPLTWERVEKIARYGERTVPIVADAQIVYFSTEEDLERFKNLQAIALKPEGIIDFEARIRALLNESYALYFSVLQDRADFTSAKLHAVHLLDNLAEIIAVANHTYIKRGWGYVVGEIIAMKIVPDGFEKLFKEVVLAEDSETLTESAFKLLQATKESVIKPDTPPDIKQAFWQLFEEEKSVYNKACRGCDNADPVLAARAGASVQDEIIRCIGIEAYRKAGFIDMVTAFSKKDLAGYKKVVIAHERQFEHFLASNGISITRYAGVEEFEKDMR